MINGVINVYKEPGFTSHDVVAKLRGIFGQRKIGHTGTLDPDAEGVLPVCLGKATRLCGMLADETKTYEAVVLLGVDTDTQDTGGNILRQSEVLCTQEEFDECLQSFCGDQMQIPPMYSALKHNGKKLYELAREGKTVEREPRPVHFFELRLLSFELPRATIRVTCSRGTYIRTLCHDIGEKLGCGACMEHLVRTRVGKFNETDAAKLDRIEEFVKTGKADKLVKPIDSVFRDLPSVSVRNSGDGLAHNGNAIPFSQISNALGDGLYDEVLKYGSSDDRTDAAAENGIDIPFRGDLRVYDSTGHFVGIYSTDTDRHILVLKKMFYDPEEVVLENRRHIDFVNMR